jgi:hypothetical protein
MADPFMEIRTMTLLEFGCPPLPIANGIRAETNESAIINSHDLLSVFMAQAFKQQDEKLNKKRKEKQIEIEDEFYQRLMLCDGTPHAIYSAMSEYTRAYLTTYLIPPHSPKDITTLPREYISPALAKQISSYHDALYMVATGSPPSPNPHATVDMLLKGCKHIHSAEKRFYARAKKAVEEKSSALEAENVAQP